jgi:tRNA(Ile)-lysidine synthase
VTGKASTPAPIEAAEAEGIFAAEALHGPILIAVSGGPDSIALMGLLARWCAQDAAKPPLHVATVDHGLRRESASEAQMVGVQAAKLGLSHRVLTWEGAKPATGIQEAARMARYGLLAGEARRVGAQIIATAHTQDDQAETVLMRFLRGSGPAGLAGMARLARRGGLLHWRPLLAVPKLRLIATCDAMGLPFINDPSNADQAYARVRLRDLMTLLAPEGLSIERLARLAHRQGRANVALEQTAAEALGSVERRAGGLVFHRHRLAEASPEVFLRALALAFAWTKAALRCNDAGETPQWQDTLRAETFLADDAAIPLEKLESAMIRLQFALLMGKSCKLTLSGLAVSLQQNGSLMLVKQPPRRSIHSDGVLSLGKGGDEA